MLLRSLSFQKFQRVSWNGSSVAFSHVSSDRFRLPAAFQPTHRRSISAWWSQKTGSNDAVTVSDIQPPVGAASAPVQIESTGGNWTVAGKITGTGSLLRDNDGATAIILAGNNDFAGGFQITNRTVTLSNKSALGTGTFTIGDATTAPVTAI